MEYPATSFKPVFKASIFLHKQQYHSPLDGEALEFHADNDLQKNAQIMHKQEYGWKLFRHIQIYPLFYIE